MDSDLGTLRSLSLFFTRVSSRLLRFENLDYSRTSARALPFTAAVPRRV
jgi:hypothetical protein